MSSPRDTVKKLMATALDTRGNQQERFNAAFQALKLIEKHDLLASPFDGLASIDNEQIKAVGSIFETLSNPELIKNVKKVASGIANRKRRSR